MSLLSLPERIFKRLVELPLELFSVVLGSQKAITMVTEPESQRGRGFLPIPDTQTGMPFAAKQFSGRYMTPENHRGVWRRGRIEEHRARHAGEWRLPGNIHGRTGRGAVGYNAQPPYGSLYSSPGREYRKRVLRHFPDVTARGQEAE